MQDIGVITESLGNIPEWMHIDGGGKTITIELFISSDKDSIKVVFDTIYGSLSNMIFDGFIRTHIVSGP